MAAASGVCCAITVAGHSLLQPPSVHHNGEFDQDVPDLLAAPNQGRMEDINISSSKMENINISSTMEDTNNSARMVNINISDAVPTTLMHAPRPPFDNASLHNFSVWRPYLEQVEDLCDDIPDAVLRQRCAARVEMLQLDIYKQPDFVCNNYDWGQSYVNNLPTHPFNFPFGAEGEREMGECRALS